MTSIVISSGHGKYIRGASGYLDEVDEARRVVDKVAELLKDAGVNVKTFHDNTSHDQNTNLNTIVNYHNAQTRDLDVSVHFNAYNTTSKPMGTEVFYGSPRDLANELSQNMASTLGLPNRGGKDGGGLFFCNNTEEPALLLEVCFVDSSADAAAYEDHFDGLCRTIATTLSGGDVEEAPPERPERPPFFPERPEGPMPVVTKVWKNITATKFGGTEDYNVSAYDENLVLNDTDLYVALPYRFEGLRPLVTVVNRETGKTATAEIWDVGPWMISDDYWINNARPIAETCNHEGTPLPSGPNEGKVPTNDAGIDVSPRLDDILELGGKGKVDWYFSAPVA